MRKEDDKLTWDEIQKLAESGDFHEMINRMLCKGRNFSLSRRDFGVLREGANNYNGGMVELVDLVFDHTLRFNLGLLMQYHLQAEHAMSYEGAFVSKASDPPPQGTESWLQRVERIQDRIIWICSTYSRIMHVLDMHQRHEAPRSLEKMTALREKLQEGAHV